MEVSGQLHAPAALPLGKESFIKTIMKSFHLEAVIAGINIISWISNKCKVKVKLSLCFLLTEHHSMKAYGGMKV